MFSTIRKRITYTNVAMTLALVFAMTGGAYAAKKYVITSTKQISPKVISALKGAKGKPGAQGPQGEKGPAGPSGAAGSQGEKGPQGPEGKAGANGENVAYKEIPTSNKAKCDGQGGAEYTVGGKTTEICNGQTGFTETLPKGKTEKGTWAVASFTSIATTGVSFNIPLKSAPSVHYLESNGQELTSGNGTPKSGKKQTSTACAGSAANPTAPEGTLCVYTQFEGNVSTEGSVNEFFFGAGEWEWGVKVDTEVGKAKPDTAMPFGFDVSAIGTGGESVQASGSWAVTG